MEVAICERFPALDPIGIRAKRAKEVFLLIRRLNRYSIRERAGKTGKNAVTKIRKPAGDNWF